MEVGVGYRTVEGVGWRSARLLHPRGLLGSQTGTDTLKAHPRPRVHFPSRKPLLVLVHPAYLSLR